MSGGRRSQWFGVAAAASVAVSVSRASEPGRPTTPWLRAQLAEGRSVFKDPYSDYTSNVALYKKCEPAPACSALVDSATAPPEPSDTAATRPSSVKVFLGRSFFVPLVVVFCSPDPAYDAVNPSIIQQRQRMLLVTSWVDDSNTPKKSLATLQAFVVAEPREDEAPAEGGVLRIEIPLRQAASAISVEWGGFRSGADGAPGDLRRCDECSGPLLITEVAVMSRPAGPFDDAPLRDTPERDAPANSVTAAGSRIAVATWDIGSHQKSAQDRLPPGGAASVVDVELPKQRFLAPLATKSQQLELPVVGTSSIIFASMLLSMAASQILIALRSKADSCEPSLEDPYLQREEKSSGTGLPRLPAAPVSSEHFWIGSPECTPLAEQQGPPAFFGPSESEPEGEPSEADEESCPGLPPSFEHKEPVAVQSQLPSTGASCAQQVTMLFASPLCHVDPHRGPTPLPQICPEREWGVLAQAYEDATASLWESSRRDSRVKPGVALTAQPLTSSSLQRSVAPGSAGWAPAVLHISAHAASDCLLLDNGRGTAHMFSCEMLAAMLDLRQHHSSVRGPRLVLINACSAQSLGEKLALKGIPHVICVTAALLDSASHVFLRALYGCLFQGGTVSEAYCRALVALRSHPEESVRTAAAIFRLLPKDGSHDVVLFPSEATGLNVIPRPSPLEKQSADDATDTTRSGSAPSSSPESTLDGFGSSCDGSGESGSEEFPIRSSSSSESDSSPTASSGCLTRISAASSGMVARRIAGCARRQRMGCDAFELRRRHAGMRFAPTPQAWLSPFTSAAAPPAPEDFLGRSVDVWSVLQLLSQRRAVVVCGGEGDDHGIGKSVVLDAVHRAFSHRIMGICVAVQLRALSDVDSVTRSGVAWIEKLQTAASNALQVQKKLSAKSRYRGSGLGAAQRSARRRRNGTSQDSRAPQGFHALTDPVAIALALEALVEDMHSLAELCEARSCEWQTPRGHILVVLDECDHLIQQQHFQNGIAELLRRCPSIKVLLSTQQSMVGTGGGHFKVVHHELRGLRPHDAARLFLRRTQRPITWGELLEGHPGASGLAGAAEGTNGGRDPTSPVRLSGRGDEQVLSLVASHPCIEAQQRNPRRLIELASRVKPGLRSLVDLLPTILCGEPCSPPKQIDALYDEAKLSSAAVRIQAALRGKSQRTALRRRRASASKLRPTISDGPLPSRC